MKGCLSLLSLLAAIVPALAQSSTSGNVTVGGTNHLYVYMMNQSPVFKAYPCTRDQLTNAPSTKSKHRMLHSSSDSDTDDSDAQDDASSCPNDSKLMVVEFRRIAELDSYGSKQGGTTVQLRDLTYNLDSNDSTKIVIDTTFNAGPSCTTVKSYNGQTTIKVTAQVLPAGSSTSSMGTLSQDSLKWSIDITNWPYCVGTQYLDVIVALKLRGSGKDTARTENHSGHKNDQKNQPSSTSVGGTSMIIFPTVATLDGNDISVNVSSQVSSGNVALTHFQLPVTYMNGTQVVYADTIFYDPAYGYINNGLSAGAIAGITIACVVVVGAVIAFVVIRKRRQQQTNRKRSFLGIHF